MDELNDGVGIGEGVGVDVGVEVATGVEVAAGADVGAGSEAGGAVVPFVGMLALVSGTGFGVAVGAEPAADELAEASDETDAEDTEVLSEVCDEDDS